jgi:hypothetical protein
LRITSESEAELVLEHNPVLPPATVALLAIAVLAGALRAPASVSAAGWVGTVLGASVAMVIAYLMALPSRVAFDAVAGEVSWSQAGWRGRDLGSCPLGDITGVDVTSRSPNDDGAQRLVLQTTHGPVPLTRDFWGFGRHEHTAVAIREWLGRNGLDVGPS